MAKNEVINLTDDDYKKKTFKAAPAGTYTFAVSSKTKIKKFKVGKQGIELWLTIVGDSKGGKTKYAKINVVDNIAATVTWKIAQLLSALGLKKTKITLAELIKLIKSKKLRGVIRIERFEGKDRNKVVQFLPLKPTEDEDADDAGDEDDEDEDEDSSDDEDEDSGDEDSDDEDSDSDDEDEENDDEDEDEEDSDSDDEDEDSDEDEDDLTGADDDDDDEGEGDEEDAEDEEEKPKPRAKKAAKKATPRKGAKKRR